MGFIPLYISCCKRVHCHPLQKGSCSAKSWRKWTAQSCKWLVLYTLKPSSSSSSSSMNTLWNQYETVWNIVVTPGHPIQAHLDLSPDLLKCGQSSRKSSPEFMVFIAGSCVPNLEVSVELIKPSALHSFRMKNRPTSNAAGPKSVENGQRYVHRLKEWVRWGQESESISSA